MIYIGLGFEFVPSMLGLKEDRWRREGCMYRHLDDGSTIQIFSNISFPSFIDIPKHND